MLFDKRGWIKVWDMNEFFHSLHPFPEPQYENYLRRLIPGSRFKATVRGSVSIQWFEVHPVDASTFGTERC